MPRASLIAQLVKNLPVMQETPVRFLGWEDPLEKGQVPTPVFLGFPCDSAGKNLPAMWETWVQSLGWEDPLEKGKVTYPVFWPGESMDYSPWDHKELDMTE